jgi:hypothetical protein
MCAASLEMRRVYYAFIALKLDRSDAAALVRVAYT